MPAYLLRMRNLKPALWCVSELRVARWGSGLVEVRGKLEAVSVLPYMVCVSATKEYLAAEKGYN